MNYISRNVDFSRFKIAFSDTTSVFTPTFLHLTLNVFRDFLAGYIRCHGRPLETLQIYSWIFRSVRMNPILGFLPGTRSRDVTVVTVGKGVGGGILGVAHRGSWRDLPHPQIAQPDKSQILILKVLF